MMAARRRRKKIEEARPGPQSPTHGSKPKDRRRLIRRMELACALALTAFILFLHLYRAIRAGALWRDELISFRCAALPSFSQIWSSCVSTPPFLSYGVLHLWVDWFGGSDASVRMFGALVGVGILSALWFDGWLLGYQTPLFALVLFGLNPGMMQWGDSPRGYGLALLLILLSCGLIWKVVESPTRRGVALAAFSSILSVQCLFQNAPLLFAACVGGALVCLRRRLWARAALVLAVGGMSALSLVPYLPRITSVQNTSVLERSTPDFLSILGEIEMTLRSGNYIFLWAWLLCAGAGLVLIDYLIALPARNADLEKRLDLALFALTVPVIGTAASLFFFKSSGFPVFTWHIVPLIGSFALSADVLMEQATVTLPGRIGRLLATLLIAAIAIPSAWKQAPVRQTNIDTISSTLQKQASQGDFIVVNPWFYGVTFQNYYRGTTPWTTAPPIEDLGDRRYDLLKEKLAQQTPLRPVFDAMEKTLRSGNRVWVVGGFLALPEGQLPPSPPPAPNSPGGWYSGYYMDAWTLQLGYFLNSHTSSSEKISLPSNQPVSPYENPPLTVFSGWRP